MARDTNAIRAKGVDLQNRNTYVVKDRVLAAALLSVGVPLARPAKLVQYASGHRQAIFIFQSHDPERIVDVSKALVASSDPFRYVAENPVCPLSFALAAIINFADIERKHLSERAVVPMAVHDQQGVKTHLWLTEGSRKHIAALRRGMKPATAEPVPSALERLVHTPETQLPTTTPQE
jgi:hypothetical protein